MRQRLVILQVTAALMVVVAASTATTTAHAVTIGRLLPTLSAREARHEIRKLFFGQYIQLGIQPSLNCDEASSQARRVCDVWLKFPGTRCHARAAVVERTDDYFATIRDFKCKRLR